MRKILILPALLLLAITACKKSSTTTSASGTITANIDGTPTTFNTDAIGILSSGGGAYQVSITGFHGTAGTSSQLTIGVAGSAPVTVGTYDDSATTAPDEVSLVYTQQPGSGYYGAIGSSPDTASVTITSISVSEVQGTFIGGLILTSGSTSPSSHTVTNGRFDVKF